MLRLSFEQPGQDTIMLGLGTMALVNTEQPKIQEMINDLSHNIESSFSDFDRSHNGSLSKKQVETIMKKVYQTIDSAKERVSEGERLLRIMQFGTVQEVESIKISKESVDNLYHRAKFIENGILRLRYVFFLAKTADAWKPHLQTLKHLEDKSIATLQSFADMATEVADMASNYLEPDDGVDFNIQAMEKDLESPFISHPHWVKTGEDFAKWIRELKA